MNERVGRKKKIFIILMINVVKIQHETRDGLNEIIYKESKLKKVPVGGIRCADKDTNEARILNMLV